MRKGLEPHVEQSIKDHIYKGDHGFAEIMKIHKVSYTVVLSMYDEVRRLAKDAEITGVIFGSKDEPYYTEEEMLSERKYKAINNHLIKPIRKDWKLY